MSARPSATTLVACWHWFPTELLARVLGCDLRPPLSIADVLELEPDALLEHGISHADADRIIALAEIARRHQPRFEGIRLTVPADAVSFLRQVRRSRVPQMVAILVDRGGSLLRSELIATEKQCCAPRSSGRNRPDGCRRQRLRPDHRPQPRRWLSGSDPCGHELHDATGKGLSRRRD